MQKTQKMNDLQEKLVNRTKLVVAKTNSLNKQEHQEMMKWLGNEAKPIWEYILYLFDNNKMETLEKLLKENELY